MPFRPIGRFARTFFPARKYQGLVQVVGEEVTMDPGARPAADLVTRGEVVGRARLQERETGIDVSQRPDAQFLRRPTHEDVGLGIMPRTVSINPWSARWHA